MTLTIQCQACTPDSRKKNGCSRCGGYGVVLEQGECPKCRRQAWFKPGVHTAYDGKTYSSFDGLEMVWHLGGANCKYCEVKP